jgi:hypothetical protein
MAICEACGTENRDKARFCIGCAKALLPLADAANAAPVTAAAVPAVRRMQACPVCQAANPLAATVCQSCRASLVPDLARPLLAASAPSPRGMAFKATGALALMLVAVAVWWVGGSGGAGHWPGADGAAVASRSALSDAQPVGLAVAVSATAAPLPAPPATEPATPLERSAEEKAVAEAARAQRTAAAQTRREQVARERAATEAQARATRALEQQRADEAARQQAAAEAAERARATAAAPPPVPVVNTVEQTCAGSGNFFSREVCRIRACQAPAFGSDPVCVRFRELEESSRSAAPN